MKRIAILLIALLPVLAAAQTRFSNPILHTDYSDPDVCRVGDDYYMTASSFNFFPGLPILHSRDLVNWQLVGAALTDYEFAFKALGGSGPGNLYGSHPEPPRGMGKAGVGI